MGEAQWKKHVRNNGEIRRTFFCTGVPGIPILDMNSRLSSSNCGGNRFLICCNRVRGVDWSKQQRRARVVGVQIADLRR